MNYLKEKDPEEWHGFQGSEYLTVLGWNTPNNTISCLWKDSDQWNALFPRIKTR